MSDRVEAIDGEEFRELGYLQEVNRRVLHPLGLALFVDTGWTRERVQEFLQAQGVLFGEDAVDNIMTFISCTGLDREHIAGALDNRDDIEGWNFGVRTDHWEEDLAEFERKKTNIESEWARRAPHRHMALGYIVQDEIELGEAGSEVNLGGGHEFTDEALAQRDEEG